jgi:hypothetical protein
MVKKEISPFANSSGGGQMSLEISPILSISPVEAWAWCPRAAASLRDGRPIIRSWSGRHKYFLKCAHLTIRSMSNPRVPITSSLVP